METTETKEETLEERIARLETIIRPLPERRIALKGFDGVTIAAIHFMSEEAQSAVCPELSEQDVRDVLNKKLEYAKITVFPDIEEETEEENAPHGPSFGLIAGLVIIYGENSNYLAYNAFLRTSHFVVLADTVIHDLKPYDALFTSCWETDHYCLTNDRGHRLKKSILKSFEECIDKFIIDYHSVNVASKEN